MTRSFMVFICLAVSFELAFAQRDDESLARQVEEAASLSDPRPVFNEAFQKYGTNPTSAPLSLRLAFARYAGIAAAREVPEMTGNLKMHAHNPDAEMAMRLAVSFLGPDIPESANIGRDLALNRSFSVGTRAMGIELVHQVKGDRGITEIIESLNPQQREDAMLRLIGMSKLTTVDPNSKAELVAELVNPKYGMREQLISELTSGRITQSKVDISMEAVSKKPQLDPALLMRVADANPAWIQPYAARLEILFENPALDPKMRAYALKSMGVAGIDQPKEKVFRFFKDVKAPDVQQYVIQYMRNRGISLGANEKEQLRQFSGDSRISDAISKL